ncbi:MULTISPECIES: aromatic-ring-hydroxylating dioxygenase subunit beta [Pandoraea]|jgi:salicylate 5-hydroxylase small subunit|uniref:Anthranilate 1,2-dioxygenase small subunit n=1 Tax=Pandoraea pnomenusa TaxID=93220 RepID=A0A378YJ09_9BURK|nr:MULTISPECIES: aromatic-ring-hydroxylating dioxygenase subunit beta [Pandoraea]AHB04716.1 salicylate hydroxylase [Pandoraea pnomenusa 3kgm]AHB74891.1 salicylate hydroxylase [Pandoraea pnomenusa]AHN76738.1 salicylate hydroxylase [Pandoraea pnomenusa]AIU26652.1 salicylate hydroxylase [Pandoraea pnomenusa]ANC43865.1 salicylate hydroxylase [Pandoraea pnomenusa]
MVDFTTFQAVVELNAAYAAALDAQQWDAWPEFFLDDCVYRIQPRENYDMGLPLATLSFESKGMLRDRIYGIRDTLFHDPYYQRHVIGLPSIRERDADTLEVEANYAVFRTKPDQLSDILSVGRYLDVIKRTGEGWKFASRQCIFDSEMIPNSLIYPI